MSERPIRLYVWYGVLTDYTSGVAVAAARSVEEARDALIAECERCGQAYLKLRLATELKPAPDVRDIPAAAFCEGGS